MYTASQNILPDLSLDVHQGHQHLLSVLLSHEHIQGKDTKKSSHKNEVNNLAFNYKLLFQNNTNTCNAELKLKLILDNA